VTRTSRLRRIGLIAAFAAVVFGGVGLERARAGGEGPRLVRLTVRSAAVPGPQRITLVLPRQGRPQGLLVLLHARGGSDTTPLTPAFLEAVRDLGPEAPAIAIPAGNRTSFWHDRANGAWGRFVMRTVLPRALAVSGADPGRVAIGGISMGGFGAYDLARLHPGRFCAVGGHSAAIVPRRTDAPPGAFDGDADFARHDLLALAASRPAAWAGRLWLDVGDDDPFAPGDRAFAAALRRGGVPLAFHVWSGGHDGRYWGAHWDDYLRFYADALASCSRR
jgi:enterochelin esterase-like enzyme